MEATECSAQKKERETLWTELAYFVPHEIPSFASNAIHAELAVMLCHGQGPNAESTEAYVSLQWAVPLKLKTLLK